MSDPLSPAAAFLVQTRFAAEHRREAAALLERECGRNLPLCADSDDAGLDRLRFAALKVSGGSLETLHEAVDLAKLDWRDLLVWAGFANDPSEHLRWVSSQQSS